MSGNAMQRIAEINGLGDVLRLITSLKEVKDGGIRLASGATKGAITFSDGHITGACVTSTGGRGLEALEQMLALSDAAFQFVPSADSLKLNKADECCVEIKALIENGFKLAGLNTDEMLQRKLLIDDAESATIAVPALKHEQLEDTSEISALLCEQAAAAAQIENPGALAELSDFLGDVENQDNPDKNVTSAVPALFKESKVSKAGATEDRTSHITSVDTTPEAAIDPNHTVEVQALYTQPRPDPEVQSSHNKEVKVLTHRELDEAVDANATVEVQALFNQVESDESGDPNHTEEVQALFTQVELDESGDPNHTEEVRGLFTPPKPKKIHLDEDPQSVTGPVPVTPLSLVEQFAKSQFVLDQREPGLSDSQKILMHEMSKLQDSEAFNMADPSLKVDDSQKEKQKLELLENAAMNVESFDVIEIGRSLEAEEALTDDQKSLLAEVKKLADPVAFQSVGARDLDDVGQVVSEDERWMAEQNASILSPEQQKEQFKGSNPALEPGAIDFQPFTDPVSSAQAVDVAALDAIARPEVFDGDFAPLIAPAAEPDAQIREKPQGLIGRVRDAVWHKMPSYMRPDRAERFSPEKMIGPVMLFGLVGALFTVPYMLNQRMGGQQSAQLAREQMRLVAEDEASDQVQYAIDDSTPGAKNEEVSLPAADQRLRGGGSSEPAQNNDVAGVKLADARSLASKGWIKRAALFYREYLNLNPQAIGIRVEMINMLLGAKEPRAARQACIEALKQKLTIEQTNEIWALFNRCLTD